MNGDWELKQVGIHFLKTAILVSWQNQQHLHNQSRGRKGTDLSQGKYVLTIGESGLELLVGHPRESVQLMVNLV